MSSSNSEETKGGNKEGKNKKKKNKKKSKGIDAFLENEEEAKAFKQETAGVTTATSSLPGALKKEDAPPKKKKSVGFSLEQNTVREFDKTKRIVEMEEDAATNTSSTIA